MIQFSQPLFVDPVADVLVPDGGAGHAVTGFVRHEKVLDIGRFKVVWYRIEDGDTRLYSRPDGADSGLIATLRGYTGVADRHVFLHEHSLMVGHCRKALTGPIR